MVQRERNNWTNNWQVIRSGYLQDGVLETTTVQIPRSQSFSPASQLPVLYEKGNQKRYQETGSAYQGLHNRPGFQSRLLIQAYQ